MSYTIDRSFPGAVMADVDARTRAALAVKGFGLVTEIDVQATMNNRLNVDMPGYRILGASNPSIAHQAMETEPEVGSRMSCNFILREVSGGVEVIAVDPVATMTAFPNDALKEVAGKVRKLLADVVAGI